MTKSRYVILFILALPLLLPLSIAAFAILFAVFITIVSLIIACGACVIAFILAPLAALFNLVRGDMTVQGFILVIGASLFMIGLSILLVKLLVQLLLKFTGLVSVKVKKTAAKKPSESVAKPRKNKKEDDEQTKE